MKTNTTKRQSAKKTAVVKCASKCAAKPSAKKPTAKKQAIKTVTFTVHAEKGKSVYLAGDFNQWDASAKKMAYKAKGGLYATTLKLAEGSYQYKFVIDGNWCADPENVNCVPNDKGTFNSVITVK